jgi:hypothetical protein
LLEDKNGHTVPDEESVITEGKPPADEKP